MFIQMNKENLGILVVIVIGMGILEVIPFMNRHLKTIIFHTNLFLLWCILRVTMDIGQKIHGMTGKIMIRTMRNILL